MDIIVHCHSEKEAIWIKTLIKERLAEFKLESHSKKTKIVYCKDDKRKGNYKNEKLDLLGFEFRPQEAKSKYKKLFFGFNPAVNKATIKGMYHEKELNLNSVA